MDDRAGRVGYPSSMHVLIAGVGWLGRGIAEACIARGWRVSGVKRRAEGLEELSRMGVEPVAVDLTDPAALDRLPRDISGIVACQAPSADSMEEYRKTYLQVNRALLALAVRSRVRGLVYTSSTGVFGQRDGSDADETTPVLPAGESAEILVEAERLVLAAADAEGRSRVGGAWRPVLEEGDSVAAPKEEVVRAGAAGIPACVVRLSGLYGPGRTGTIDRVRRGVLALGPGDDAWMNFCHRDDAVQTVIAALERGRPGAVYHASDAFPSRRRDVVLWIAQRLGIEPPVLLRDESLAPGGRRGANRRILAERTRAELGVRLRYPSFRDGFAPFLPPPR